MLNPFKILRVGGLFAFYFIAGMLFAAYLTALTHTWIPTCGGWFFGLTK